MELKVFPSALWVTALAVAFVLGRSGRSTIEPDAGPVSSIAQALDEHDPVARSYELSRALGRLTADRISEVIAVVAEQPERWSEHDQRVLMSAWTHFDELAPVDWALSQTGSTRTRAGAAAIEVLAVRDPLSARSVVDSLEDPELTDLLHDRMILGWARSGHQDDLNAHITAMLPGIRRQKAAAILANQIMREGPDALIEWAEGVPVDAPKGYKEIAFDKAANALALADPELASRWIQSHLGRPYAALGSDVVAKRWVESDPAAALDWTLTLPAGDARILTVASSFVLWLEQDPAAAEAWVLSASPATSADPAVRILVRRDYLPQPAAALDWAQRIADPGLRKRVLAAVGRSWFARDPEAVESWLPESGIELQIQHLILHSRPRHGETAAELENIPDGRTAGNASR